MSTSQTSFQTSSGPRRLVRASITNNAVILRGAISLISNELRTVTKNLGLRLIWDENIKTYMVTGGDVGKFITQLQEALKEKTSIELKTEETGETTQVPAPPPTQEEVVQVVQAAPQPQQQLPVPPVPQSTESTTVQAPTPVPEPTVATPQVSPQVVSADMSIDSVIDIIKKLPKVDRALVVAEILGNIDIAVNILSVEDWLELLTKYVPPKYSDLLRRWLDTQLKKGQSQRE